MQRVYRAVSEPSGVIGMPPVGPPEADRCWRLCQAGLGCSRAEVENSARSEMRQGVPDGMARTGRLG